MPLKSFLETLERMKEIHNSKSQDYANPNNPLSNFDVSEYGLHLFKSDRDKCFAWPIFTKLARLATLLNSGNTPNNESIEDSFVDIANYVILWKCDFMMRNHILGPTTPGEFRPMTKVELQEYNERITQRIKP